MSDKITIDFNDLTYGDLELIEEHLGGIPDNFEGPDVPRVKLAMVMALISMRKTNPDATMDDVRKMGVDAIAWGDSGNSPEADTPE